MVWALHKIHPDKMTWDKESMNRLVGTTRLEKMIYEGSSPSQIFSAWEKEINTFNNLKTQYLIY